MSAHKIENSEKFTESDKLIIIKNTPTQHIIT